MVEVQWPDCIVDKPHIVADPCHPRWVVKCEHDVWFYHQTPTWIHKRDEYAAYFALMGLFDKIFDHANGFVKDANGNFKKYRSLEQTQKIDECVQDSS